MKKLKLIELTNEQMLQVKGGEGDGDVVPCVCDCGGTSVYSTRSGGLAVGNNIDPKPPEG